ncbi:MAG: radical SAM protein [Acidobacteria bacterium]|nr:radical SAM protein [Acidobacteriota bacterium]
MEQKTLFELAPLPAQGLRQRGQTSHLALRCKTLLNYCDTDRMPDTFTINPYRGCEFGCSYCYARYTHEFMHLEWSDFQRKIYVKLEAPKILLKTLDLQKLRGRHIAIGTATDPYQPAEARFQITRRLLEVFSRLRGLSLSITTKSALVYRDLDLFIEISRHNDFQIQISLISLDSNLLRSMEPLASRPLARLEALRRLREEGIRAGINLMPIIPVLTDSENNLREVIAAASRYRAAFLYSGVLFLREPSKQAFFDFIDRVFPQLSSWFRSIYGKGVEPSRRYQARIQSLVSALKKDYGFSAGAETEPLFTQENNQELSLPFEALARPTTPSPSSSAYNSGGRRCRSD